MLTPRSLYNQVLRWSQSRHCEPLLWLLSASEAIFFPLPPETMLLPMGMTQPHRVYRFALGATLASLAGGVVGFGLGWGLWHTLQDFFFQYVPGFTPALYDQFRSWVQQYDFWIIFAAGFTPLPYKIFTIGAGALKLNLGLFVVASFLSRGLRFVLWALLLNRFSEPVRLWLERHFNLLTLVVLAVLVLWMMWH